MGGDCCLNLKSKPYNYHNNYLRANANYHIEKYKNQRNKKVIDEKDKKIKYLKEQLKNIKNGTFQEEDLISQKSNNSNISLSSKSSVASEGIIIVYNGHEYSLNIKPKYDLTKVLCKFKENYPELKPHRSYNFYFNGELLDDHNKKCGELNLYDGALLQLRQ